MAIRPSSNDPIRSHSPNNVNDTNSSAADRAAQLNAALPIRGVARGLLSSAPQCVQDMDKGTLPKKAADFNVCVGWLVKNDQREALQKLLPQCSQFDKLDLRGQEISAPALECLAHCLVKSSVAALNLSGCQLGQDHAKAIGTLLEHDSPLTLLNLSGNPLVGPGGKVVAQICQSLEVNQTLKHLNLANCGLVNEDCAKVLSVLSRHEYEHIGGKDKTVINAQNTTLQSLSLAGNQLVLPSRVKGETTGLEGEGNMPGVKWLDLSNTDVLLCSDTATELFGNFSVSLKRLDFAGNAYRQDAVGSSFHQLQNKQIMYLNLSNISREGHGDMQDLSPLKAISSLTVVDLSGVKLEAAAQERPDWSYESLDREVEYYESLEFSLTVPPEFAIHPRAQQFANFNPLNDFRFVANAAGAFLVKVGMPEDLAGPLATHLDARTAMTLATLDRQLAYSPSSFRAGLRELSGDSGFDWDLACRVEEVADDDSSDAAIITTILPPPTITTTTTTETTVTMTTTGTTTTSTTNTENNDSNSSSSSSNASGSNPDRG